MKINKTKILFILPHLKAGGAERVVSFIFKNLNRTIFDTKLVVIGFKKDNHYSVQGEDVVYLNRLRLRNAFFDVIKTIKTEKPDLVFSSIGHINIYLEFLKICYRSLDAIVYQSNDMKNNFEQLFNVILKMFTFAIILLTMLISILLPFILSGFFDSEYSYSSQYFYILCVSSCINAISAFTDLGILLSEKSFYYLLNSIIFFLVTLVSMYFLIELFGVLGIVVSTLIGNLVKFFSGYLFAQKGYRINWDIKPIIYLIVLTILISFISTYLDFHNSVYLLLFQLLGLISLSFFFWFYLMNKREKYSQVVLVKDKYKNLFN